MKKVYDSLHGFVYLDTLEESLVRSRPLIRLQGVLQLGTAYLVYPGATHSRFEHSLGTMVVATKIFDHLAKKSLTEMFCLSEGQIEYYRKVIRFSALCHDLGHLPFSHSAESILLGDAGHEGWTMKLIFCDELQEIWNRLGEEIHQKYGISFPNIALDIAKYSIGKEKMSLIDPSIVFSPIDHVLSEIVTADLFGADRIDYLLRDAKATGLPYGNIDFTQLIDSLHVTIDVASKKPQLIVKEGGIESCEALILARYFMHQRLCQYPSVKSYSFHISRFMKSFYEEQGFLHSLDRYVQANDHVVLADVYKASYDESHPRHFDALRLVKQKSRFEAIRLPPNVTLPQILELKEKLSIPDSMMGWDFNSREKLEFDLSFLPFKEQEQLTRNWIFIDSDYKQSFLLAMGWNEKADASH